MTGSVDFREKFLNLRLNQRLNASDRGLGEVRLVGVTPRCGNLWVKNVEEAFDSILSTWQGLSATR